MVNESVTGLQGSILGLLLYLVFVNYTKAVLFADDTTLTISGKNLKFGEIRVNNGWKLVKKKNNSLKLNTNKITLGFSEIIIISIDYWKLL